LRQSLSSGGHDARRGLEGIEKDLDPGDPNNVNMYELSDAQLAKRGVKRLPRTLLEAVESFAADPLSETVCGADSAARLYPAQGAGMVELSQCGIEMGARQLPDQILSGLAASVMSGLPY